MSKSRLHQLSELGQSVWIDYLSREMLRTGELERLMRDDAVVGITSNPTIFQKAISQGERYDEQIRACLGETDDPKEIFWRLARRTSATRATCSVPSGMPAKAGTATSRSRSTPTSQVTRTGRSPKRGASTPRSTGRTCS